MKKLYLALIWIVLLNNTIASKTFDKKTHVCIFSEYSWHHIDKKKRILTKNPKEEFVFSFDIPEGFGHVTTGTYKNLVKGWSGQIKVLGNPSRYTIIEDAEGDNVFTASIFTEKYSTGQFKAVMTLHSVSYGISQLDGMCR
jgi:hypothetical protein